MRGVGCRGELEGKGPQWRPQKRLDRRLEEVAEAVGGGYCRLRMPGKRALAVRETVAGHRLGALEGGLPPPPLPMPPWVGGLAGAGQPPPPPPAARVHQQSPVRGPGAPHPHPPIGGGEHPPNSTASGATSCGACGAGVGGTPSRRGGTCE